MIRLANNVLGDIKLLSLENTLCNPGDRLFMQVDALS